jgi:pyrimidine-specific ribonucleoside hydrolase
MRMIIILILVMTGYIISAQDKGEMIEANDHANTGHGVVYSSFPLNKNNYAADVQVIMEDAIEGYGSEEWRLVVLTSELHGHLGIYAIIGAKMGLYAREILDAGHDELVIQSSAGSRPPVSCLNDGLQVSTGATLGHGLISIKEVETPIPAAEFTYNGKTVKISLKEVFQKDIERNIKEAIKIAGGLNDEYWQRVRELAISCWLEFDRKEIFEAE